MNYKNDNAYKSIGEVAKILNLVNKKTGKLNTHTIRFWEKEFKQIKPKIFSGKRRYYDKKTVEVLIKIKKESLKKNIDPKITKRIWKNMIWSYIDFERRNFKKK